MRTLLAFFGRWVRDLHKSYHHTKSAKEMKHLRCACISRIRPSLQEIERNAITKVTVFARLWLAKPDKTVYAKRPLYGSSRAVRVKKQLRGVRNGSGVRPARAGDKPSPAVG